MSSSWTTRAETDADITTIHEINSAAFDTTDEADLGLHVVLQVAPARLRWCTTGLV
jgi:predicted N-acetyltransferase YhbS